VIRQGRRRLTLVRMTPDIIYDQLIGAGCARKLVFSWGGNPGVGSLHRFRDAYENGWPGPLEIEEHSHAGMANRLRPDVTVIHAQRADRAGNVQLWGITGVQKEAVLAARRSVVTVEEIVDELSPRPGAVVLPAWTVSYVAAAPGGAHPSYALDYSVRDNDFYVAWDAISRDREAFTRWLDAEVFGTAAVR
jgi:glutaconate CoA-transferase subunit A